jgi:allantoate deiminase
MVTEGASGDRAVTRCDLLGVTPYSDAPDMLVRTYLSPAHRAALDQLAEWMRAAGMVTRIDPAGNLVGRYEGSVPNAPTLLTGSHIDSVRDAGRYDGPLGIMLGIEVVASLHEKGQHLAFPIEVIAFGDEEGSRFPASMLCSRAVGGILDDDALAGVVGRDGIPLTQALGDFGLDPRRFHDAARAPGSVLAFLEVHIEQGPVLEAEELALGVVTGIAAQLRFQCRVVGIAGHAGTNSMALRRDALAAAAEMMMAIEQVGRMGAEGLVATVGQMTVGPGAVNVVPGRVDFSMDVRAGQNAERDAAAREIRARLDQIAVTRGVTFTCEQVQDLPASPCDPLLIEFMERAVVNTGQHAKRLVSGAGHDSMSMAALAPTAMLFIRCAGGISHNPAESVDPADADFALRAMQRFVMLLEENFVGRHGA